MDKKLKLHPVEKVNCKSCGELLMKIFPNGMITGPNISGVQIVCIKCFNAKKK